MTIAYSETQKEYWAKRPANVINYDCVVFYHPDFGYINLVGNQFVDKTFTLDGDPVTFQAVAMESPGITAQATDNTQAGTIVFGRIGLTVRQKLMQITPLGAIKYPITARLLNYQTGVSEPIYDRLLYVDKDGVLINNESVNIKLSIDNPAKLTKKDLFYDPAVFTGLAYL